MKNLFLNGRCIGLSISRSPDMEVLGMGKEHLDDAMTEIARHLIACGGTLAYGGDLREKGFTELLFEVVNRYRLNKDSDKILVRNYLAWPVHGSMNAVEIGKWRIELEGLARLVLLAPDGKEMELADRAMEPAVSDERQWADGLTAMRLAMASDIEARIALGGQTAKYKGRLPGIAEEALIQMKRKAPLYILGGFGGCSFDLASAMGIDRRDVPRGASSGTWAGIEQFKQFGAADLRNGLTASENRLLAETVHIDQAVALILRGLMKVKRRRPSSRSS